MDRIYLQRAANGYRVVQGEVVRHLQTKLFVAGFDPGIIDGIYAQQTEQAVRSFQAKRGQPITGTVTEQTWTSLLHAPPPSILDRCLQVTADFSGHGFRKIAGNFNGAGLTWGILGFTLESGEIQGILDAAERTNPLLLQAAFGELKDELVAVMQKHRDRQLAWADAISTGADKAGVEEPWAKAFAKLGSYVQVQALQLRRARDFWLVARRDCERFGLRSEAGFALCFDIAVQHGGINEACEAPRLLEWMAQHPGYGERDLLLQIADTVARCADEQDGTELRARKRTIATGNGEVHGDHYATGDWGIAEHPWN